MDILFCVAMHSHVPHGEGVMLSHSNLVAAAAGFYALSPEVGLDYESVYLAYLPLAHIMELWLLAHVTQCSTGSGLFTSFGILTASGRI
eukprot:4042677-Amphidinium_carterae.2